MVDQNTAEYYERREAAERSRAAKCLDKLIAAIHLTKVERYADMADQARAGARPRLTIVEPGDELR